MQCLYCHKRLGLFASKKRPFCSQLHENWYQDEQSGSAIRRLLEPFPDNLPPLEQVQAAAEVAAVPEPLAAEPVVVRSALAETVAEDAVLELPLVRVPVIKAPAKPVKVVTARETPPKLPEFVKPAEPPPPLEARRPIPVSAFEPPPLHRYLAQLPTLIAPPPSAPGDVLIDIGIASATVLPVIQALPVPLAEELEDLSKLTPPAPVSSPESMETYVDAVVLEALFPLVPRARAPIQAFPSPAPMASTLPPQLPLRTDEKIVAEEPKVTRPPVMDPAKLIPLAGLSSLGFNGRPLAGLPAQPALESPSFTIAAPLCYPAFRAVQPPVLSNHGWSSVAVGLASEGRLEMQSELQLAPIHIDFSDTGEMPTALDAAAYVHSASVHGLYPAKSWLTCPSPQGSVLSPESRAAQLLPSDAELLVPLVPNVPVRKLQGAEPVWLTEIAIEPPSPQFLSSPAVESIVAILYPLAPGSASRKQPGISAAAVRIETTPKPPRMEVGIAREDSAVSHPFAQLPWPMAVNLLSATRNIAGLGAPSPSGIRVDPAPARNSKLKPWPEEAPDPLARIPRAYGFVEDPCVPSAPVQSLCWGPRRPALRIPRREPAVDIVPAPSLVEGKAHTCVPAGTVPSSMPWFPQPPSREPAWHTAFPERVRPASLIETGQSPAHPPDGRIALCGGVLTGTSAIELTKLLDRRLVQVPPTRRIGFESELWRLIEPRATPAPLPPSAR